jgi:hypothetical protein
MAGCGTSVAGMEAGTQVFAFDTSGSAKDAHEQYFNRGLHDVMASPRGSRAVVYRFDIVPQEAYQGGVFPNDEEAARLLKSTFDRSAGAKGTNILKLLQEIDRRAEEWSKPISITIYTDCGTELMSPDEFKQLHGLTKAWADKGSKPSLKLVGVDTGFRETLRNAFAFPVDIE